MKKTILIGAALANLLYLCGCADDRPAATTTTVASKTDDSGDDDKKKKGKQIALAQKVSRVTVTLPPKYYPTTTTNSITSS